MKKVTNSCYLDSNILIYFQDSKSPFYRETREMVSKLVKEEVSLVISPLVIDEYIYNSSVSSDKVKKESLKMVKQSLSEILKLPQIVLANPPLKIKKQFKVLKLMEKYSLKPRDAYHLLIILENKIKSLATFDSDFENVFAKGIVKKFIQ